MSPSLGAHADEMSGFVEHRVKGRVIAHVQPATDETRLALAPVAPGDRHVRRNQLALELVARHDTMELPLVHVAKPQNIHVGDCRIIRHVPSNVDAKLDTVASFLRNARSVLFVTGAGISAESGIPTYRGMGGLYDDVDTSEGMSIEEALSGETLRQRPELTWKYIHQIEAASRGANFNRAHEVLSAFEERIDRVWILTQNVDGFHRRAGSTRVIDLHGDIHTILCTSCSYRTSVEDYSGLAPLPVCPECTAPLRPDVVLFGELLPFEKVETMQRELARGFDVVFSIGTTSVFPYIVRPVLDAKLKGKPTVEINPDTTMISAEVDVQLPLGAVAALDSLWSRLNEE